MVLDARFMNTEFPQWVVLFSEGSTSGGATVALSERFECDLFHVLGHHISTGHWRGAMQQNGIVASFKRHQHEQGSEVDWRVVGVGWKLEGVNFQNQFSFPLKDFEKLVSLSHLALVYLANRLELPAVGDNETLALAITGLSKTQLELMKTEQQLAAAPKSRFCVPECSLSTEENMIQCGICQNWFHIVCLGMSMTDFQVLSLPTAQWTCLHCQSEMTTIKEGTKRYSQKELTGMKVPDLDRILRELGCRVDGRKDVKVQRILDATDPERLQNIERTLLQTFGQPKNGYAPLHSFYKTWFSVIDKANQKKWSTTTPQRVMNEEGRMIRGLIRLVPTNCYAILDYYSETKVSFKEMRLEIARCLIQGGKE